MLPKKGRWRIPLRARFAWLGAIFLLCIAVAAYPADEDAAVRSITTALRAKRFQEALDLARAARRTSPKEVRILVLEGMALTGLHKDGEALAALKAAIEISPDYVPAIEAAAEIEYRQGSPEAAGHLRRVLTLRPNEPTAHAMLGALAWKQSDCGAAVQHFSQAKTAIAAQPDALREYGACLLQMKHPEEAAGSFPAVDCGPAARPSCTLLACRLADGWSPPSGRDRRSRTAGGRA